MKKGFSSLQDIDQRLRDLASGGAALHHAPCIYLFGRRFCPREDQRAGSASVLGQLGLRALLEDRIMKSLPDTGSEPVAIQSGSTKDSSLSSESGQAT